ncbi:MAG: choice-of-anchor V domain-containing protein [Luteibaculaceae bacterium]
MKKTLLATFLMSIAIFSYDALTVEGHANSTGSPIGRTGSPGDNNLTCTTCHAGTTTPFEANWISTNIPETGYEPGETYQITFTATGISTNNRFGFLGNAEITGGSNVGTWTSNTQVNVINAANNRSAVTHRSTSNSGTGSRSWTADWTAPDSNVGEITFYAAFNVTNAGSGGSGGNIRRSSLAVLPNLTLAVNKLGFTDRDVKVFPNPAAVGSTVSIQIPQSNQTLFVEVRDVTGKLMQNQAVTTDRVEITTNGLKSGIYLISIYNADTRITKKLVLR